MIENYILRNILFLKIIFYLFLVFIFFINFYDYFNFIVNILVNYMCLYIIYYI
jgi:hypothetical protein